MKHSFLRVTLAALLLLSLPAAARAQSEGRDIHRRFVELADQLDSDLPDYQKLRDPAFRTEIRDTVAPTIQSLLDHLPSMQRFTFLDDIAYRREAELLALGYVLGIEDIVRRVDEHAASTEADVYAAARAARTAVDFFNAETEEAREQAITAFVDLASQHGQRPDISGGPAFMLAVAPDTATQDRLLDMIRKRLTSVAAGTVALQYEAPRRLRGLIGQPINFRYRTVDGNPLQASDFRGRVLILHFFATTSDASLRAQNRAQRVWITTQARGVDLVSVSSDTDRADLTLWIQRNRQRVTFPILFDTFTAENAGGWHPLTLELGISKLPTTLLIDRRGVLRYVNPEDLDARVQALAAEAP